MNKNLTFVAGGNSVGVLSCFGGGAARRGGKSQFKISLRVAAPRPRKYPWQKNQHRQNTKPGAVRGVLYYLVNVKGEYCKSSLPLSCTAEIL